MGVLDTRRIAESVFSYTPHDLILVGHTHEQHVWRLRSDVPTVR